MTSQDLNLTLNLRTQLGKGLNQLRREGQLPGVIHNPGADSVVISGATNEVTKVYQEAGKHHPINIKIDDKDYFTIIKDVDIDPVKHQLRHVVFGVIDRNVKVETEVPVTLIGDAPAHKVSLLVIKQLEHVQIEALPKDLPSEVTVSAEGLAEVGDRITVADIIVPAGVTILTEAEHLIAIVEEAPAQVSEEAAEAEAEAEKAAESGEAATQESTEETKE